MTKKSVNINFLFPLAALVILIFALSQQMFGVAPIGPLLDPFSGAVQSNDEHELYTSRTISGMGLRDTVQIFFDDRKVPHIYARSHEDLYFAQGYVTAYLRLWQMDFLSYASAGRLSEIFSDGFADYDRTQRRMGVPEAARRALTFIQADTETNNALTAYTKGVNAYIGSLDHKRMPFEYKLLNYTPEPWSPLKSVLVMKYMAQMLTGHEDDFSLSNLMLALGEEKFNKLFPDFTKFCTPVVGGSSGDSTRWQRFIKKPAYLDYAFMTSGTSLPQDKYNPRLGSNSWVVSGAKTRSGFPILCNDPHLGLSLPAIWLEMQLSSTDMNVYGVSIPGTPAVVIGFNENIAWGITNGEDDVKDWYKLKIGSDYRKYELDGKWVDLTSSVEEIKRKGRSSIYDTIYHTVQGPIVFDKAFPGPKRAVVNFAMRWELQNPSNEFLTFMKLGSARNYEDYKAAVMHYHCPVQNFTFACRDNTIAVTHKGAMALKLPGEGKFLLDGSNSLYLYKRYIPEDSLPQSVNPPCNFIVSANQHPTDASYRYYYNGYFNETRAHRIRQILESEDSFDIRKMESMQLDNVNYFAVMALPVLLNRIDKQPLTVDQRKELEVFRKWKGNYDPDDCDARFFELWWKYIKEYTWDEFKDFPFYAKQPEDDVLIGLIRDAPGDEFFDRQGTTARENADDIVREAFITAAADYHRLKEKGSVKWGDLNKVNIMHLTNIAAFSRMQLSSAGYPDAINAMSANWGPSWRMIVELGDRPRAFGIYPGGQSGNMGSRYYDNFVDKWNKGGYYPLSFFMSIDEARDNGGNTWTLK